MINVLIQMELMSVNVIKDTAEMLPMDYVKVYKIYVHVYL